MKIIIKIARVWLSIALILLLFLWMSFHGSGHNIPLKIDLTFVYAIGTVIVLLACLYVFNLRYKNNAE